MTRGGSVHLAPRGAAGIAIFMLLGSRCISIIENASERPSGDHCRFDGDCSRCATCVVAPSASMYRTNSCAPAGSPCAT